MRRDRAVTHSDGGRSGTPLLQPGHAVTRAMTDAAKPSPAEAAAAAHAHYDDIAARTRPSLDARGLTPACRAGCAWCCHTNVHLLPPEAFRLAEHVDTLPEPTADLLKSRVTEHRARQIATDGAAQNSAKAPCPFLDAEEHICAVHAARPLKCRGTNGLDANACRAALQSDTGKSPLPKVAAYFTLAQAIQDRLDADLQADGKTPDRLEMTGALSVIWTEPDAQARWQAGEDIFADCRAADIAKATPRGTR